MPINRFTRLSTPRFDPLSLKEISLVPTQLRQQQDLAEQEAENLALIKSQRLSPDETAVSGAISQYEQDVADYVDRLQSEGFSNLSKSGLRNLARRRRDLLSPTGIVGKAQSAYNAYQANAKQLAKMYQTGKISSDKYQRGLQNALSLYEQEGGVTGGASYNPFTAVVDEDINKAAREVALDIQRNPKVLERFGLTKRGNRYYDITTRREYTPEQAISLGIQSILGQNPEIQSDLQQRSQLGLLGEFSPSGYLKNLGDTYEALYSKDKQTIKRSGFFDPLELHRAKKSIDNASNNQEVPYVYDPVRSKQITNQSFINKVDDIAKGKPHRSVSIFSKPRLKYPDGSINPNYAEELEIYNKAKRDAGKPITKNDLAADEKVKYDKINQQLIEKGVISPLDSDSIQAEKIKQYLDQFKDVQYSIPIVKPLTSSGPISSALLLDTKNIKKTNREIMNEIQGDRISLWDENGNLIKAKDLPENMTIEYIGYVSPSNILPTFKNASPDQSIVPHKIQIMSNNKIWKEVYAQRGDYERNKPEFDAYRIIKQTTVDGVNSPALDNNYEVQKGTPLYNAGLSKYSVSYNPLNKTYNVSATLRDGTFFTEQNMPTEKYETFWYNVVKGINKK